MMTAGDQKTGRTASRILNTATRRLGVFSAASFAALCAFTNPIALQDVSSLLDHHVSPERWTAFTVPSPIGRAEAATIGFVNSPKMLKVGVDASSAIAKATEGMTKVQAIARGFAEPFDDGKVARAAKGGRVFVETPASKLPPRGFSAGSIMERQSLLGPRVLGGQARIRTAFSQIAPAQKDAMRVAANFKLLGPPRIEPLLKKTPEPVQVASLHPDGAVGDTNALGYAGTSDDARGRTASLFEKILKDQPSAFIPPVDGDDHGWAATPLPSSAMSASEQDCLANGLYFEARGESTMGEAAVGQVILNRVRNPAYPDTICGVVYQNKSWRNRCQFSFACDGKRDIVADKVAWNRSKRIAEQVTKGEIWINEVGSATHYHANYVHPRWASAMQKVDRIGKHVFYRTYNGGW